MTVFLVGAGPGDADLLTLRAVRLLARADVVVHDRLIGDDVLALVHPAAIRLDVGKGPGDSRAQRDINQLLVELGRDHECVVRLKGGDPFVFGRGGEEAEVLSAHGIDVRIVPGISSAFAAPLLAGIPVTQRGLAHGVTVVTGSAVTGQSVDFASLANADLTLVVLMGVAPRARIAAQLMQGGLAPSTPVAAIEWAASARERCVRCSLDELATTPIEAPAVLVIGRVAALDVAHARALASHWAPA